MGNRPIDSIVTPAMLHIMLALAEEDRHGYGIMQEIHRRTSGRLELGPGTLYRSVKHMLRVGLIEDVSGPADSGQRRVYRLTAAGRVEASGEARRLSDIVDWAAASRLIERQEAH